MSCRIPPSHQSGAKDCSLYIKIQILTWTEKYCSNWVGTATVTSSKSDTCTINKDKTQFNIVCNVAILPIVRGEKGLFSRCPSGTSCLSSAWAWSWWRPGCPGCRPPCRGCTHTDSASTRAQCSRGQPWTGGSHCQLENIVITSPHVISSYSSHNARVREGLLRSQSQCSWGHSWPIRGLGTRSWMAIVAMLKVAILITWIMQIVILLDRDLPASQVPGHRPLIGQFYAVLGCDWLSQDTRSQGVTFILQELRSPGGLIERCSLNFAAECINQDKT